MHTLHDHPYAFLAVRDHDEDLIEDLQQEGVYAYVIQTQVREGRRPITENADFCVFAVADMAAVFGLLDYPDEALWEVHPCGDPAVGVLIHPEYERMPDRLDQAAAPAEEPAEAVPTQVEMAAPVPANPAGANPVEEVLAGVPGLAQPAQARVFLNREAVNQVLPNIVIDMEHGRAVGQPLQGADPANDPVLQAILDADVAVQEADEPEVEMAEEDVMGDFVGEGEAAPEDPQEEAHVPVEEAAPVAEEVEAPVAPNVDPHLQQRAQDLAEALRRLREVTARAQALRPDPAAGQAAAPPPAPAAVEAPVVPEPARRPQPAQPAAPVVEAAAPVQPPAEQLNQVLEFLETPDNRLERVTLGGAALRDAVLARALAPLARMTGLEIQVSSAGARPVAPAGPGTLRVQLGIRERPRDYVGTVTEDRKKLPLNTRNLPAAGQAVLAYYTNRTLWMNVSHPDAKANAGLVQRTILSWLRQFPNGEDRANQYLQLYVEELTGAIEELDAENERDIMDRVLELSAQIQRLNEQLAGMVRERGALVNRVANTENQDIQHMQRTMTQVMDLPGVIQATLKDGVIEVLTERVLLDIQNDRRGLQRFDLGSYEIKLDVPRKLINIRSVDRPDEGHPHPHITGDQPCLGNSGAEIHEHFRAGRFTETISMLLAYLHHYNAASPYRRPEAMQDWVVPID